MTDPVPPPMSDLVSDTRSDMGVDAVALRRELHSLAELAHGEHRTAARIAKALAGCRPDRMLTGVGGTGVIATFDSGRPGPAVLVRAELDALPIPEHGVDGHASVQPGVSHKCGHDGHMAIVAGLAARLAERPVAAGRVHLVFQPAEETGTGAARVIDDPAFAELDVDLAVALHNMPGVPMHSVVVKAGPMTAAVASVVVSFAGSVAHASEPEHGRNPARAVADLIRWCGDTEVLDAESPGFCTLTPVHVLVGSPAYGVSPGDGEVHLTMRAWTNAGLANLIEQVTNVARDVGGRDGLTVGVRQVEYFAANENDPAVTALVRRAAVDAGLEVIEPMVGLRAGEDFGRFGERVPACMVLLGAGEHTPPIHDAGYDFPDDLIPTGVALFEQVVRTATSVNG